MCNFARQYDGRFPQRAGCDPQKTMNYSLTHFFGILEKDIFKHLVAAMPFFCACLPSAAQDVAVKTNLLYDAALTLNLGAEVRLLPRWTMDVSGNLNAWAVNGHRWKHWVVQPEFRYWFCESFSGHFLGAHLIGGQYNWGNLGMDFRFLGTDFSRLRDHRYQGWMGGAGIAYGYSWIIGRHWNIEAEIGLGWVYTRYDEFECADCGKRTDSDHPHNYVGPTKAAVNLIYTF